APIAKSESPRVRLQLACTAQRIPPKTAIALLRAVHWGESDLKDAYIPLAVWWGIERHAIAAQPEILDWVTSPEAWKSPLIHETVLPRLMQRYAAEGTTASLAACERLLEAAPDAAERRRMLTALEAGLRLIGSQPKTGLLPGELLAEAAVKDAKQAKQQ